MPSAYPGDNAGVNIKGLDKNTIPRSDDLMECNMPSAYPGDNAGVNIKGPDKNNTPRSDDLTVYKAKEEETVLTHEAVLSTPSSATPVTATKPKEHESTRSTPSPGALEEIIRAVFQRAGSDGLSSQISDIWTHLTQEEREHVTKLMRS